MWFLEHNRQIWDYYLFMAETPGVTRKVDYLQVSNVSAEYVMSKKT